MTSRRRLPLGGTTLACAAIGTLAYRSLSDRTTEVMQSLMRTQGLLGGVASVKVVENADGLEMATAQAAWVGVAGFRWRVSG